MGILSMMMMMGCWGVGGGDDGDFEYDEGCGLYAEGNTPRQPYTHACTHHVATNSPFHIPSPPSKTTTLSPTHLPPIPLYRELDVPSTLQDYRDPDVRYIGEGVDTAGLIVSTLHGGQVVLDAAAWEAVHEVLPLQCQALDLGVHYVWPPNSSTPNAPLAALEPMQLMEVMPGMLSYRDFPPLRTFKQLQPGYRDAPPPNKDMVIMFLRVVKPREVGDAQQCFKTIPHNGGVGVGGVGEGGHGHGKKHVAGGVHGGEQEGEDGQGDVPSTNHQGHDEQGVDDMAVAEGPVGSGGSIHSATRTLEQYVGLLWGWVLMLMMMMCGDVW